MKTLEEIYNVIEDLSEEIFKKLCDAIDNYFEKGGALQLYNVGKKIGLTVEEIWAWEND